ncbi:DedA family protein [Prochlorococcus marinus]|uniref:DedA family putative alkaline phosphatase-like protein n=1 Tax=Prochlorococcus marinus (strain MIT 9211) TaxID=93059 RepID=A9BD68_PROM4|nr:DedA family protein [Prochlorococcus marinus]ABX09681.1 DedA family; putative alkaline phosphatase-like protein [Prochlorococcus marinus str. MIT 9211]
MDFADLASSLINIIGNAVEANQWVGYIAILLAMFLENLFPPIPSELIMPLGGFYVYQGQLNFIPVVLAGLIGTVLGAFPWYGIGRLINEERLEVWLEKYGKWIGISPQELSRSRVWFARYGTSLVFWGRLVPGIRTLISVPAGVELMPIAPFILWTSAGSLIWTIFLTVAGILLGESYSRVEVWLEPFSKIIKILIIFALSTGFLWLIIRTFSKRNQKVD